ncbi:TIGR03086 family metal-binding protein [Amycolatopsis sp. PS_44_ISF1]|uniref:TIGR03086 family metal-binding protein n=1 Tax=Amycolatopsis sp. PS_44_ISF1 TaxID=2974917 RepID=UPI0028DFEC16|nr:TIGR03086 family metal-binding protein [Amycolatopsis sp. PS_44_ISF1]MDT8912635.1 TIGR03086 family metal-binding protein [Amycolatopsis sp. PS_44_ISF1]
MDLLDAHGRAVDVFDRAVRETGPAGWGRGTPCTEWSVRDVVNHLVAEQLWVPHLLAGATLDDVGDRFEGDVLGEDPVAAWARASAAARAAWLSPGAVQHTVHVSFGLIPAEEYGWQMTLDLAVHGWDVATALGRPNPVPDELAGRLLDMLRPMVEQWQGLGVFDPPVAAGRTADAPTRLVALLGRHPR